MKILKNIGMVLLIIFLTLITLYFVNSCSSIFTTFELHQDNLIGQVYSNKDRSKQLSFIDDGILFKQGEDTFSCTYDLDFNFIYVHGIDEDDKTFYAMSDNRLYSQSYNCYFYKLQGEEL